jgi:arabinose-5-phosphate isomerase
MDDIRDTTDADVLTHGRAILRAEAEAVLQAADALGGDFVRAVRLVEGCTGSVVVTGIGKAGIVARKVSATLASTGTPSHFLHPAEAVHGDLGMLRRDDLVLALSQSGESEEIVRLLPHVTARGIGLVAITGRPESTLGRAARVVIATGTVREACLLGLAPSTRQAMRTGKAPASSSLMKAYFTAAPARSTPPLFLGCPSPSRAAGPQPRARARAPPRRRASEARASAHPSARAPCGPCGAAAPTRRA